MMNMNIHGVESITVKPVKEGQQGVQWRDIEIVSDQGTMTITLYPKDSSKLAVTLLEDQVMITYETKLQVFGQGHPQWDAKFPSPGVHTTLWDAQDWIRWVDKNGRWIRKEKEQNL